MLWPHFAPHQMCPHTSSQVPSQAVADAKTLYLPKSIRHCCLYTSICSALPGRCCEEAEEWEALPNHGLLSLPHAYIPVVPLQADQARCGQNGMADTGVIGVGDRS